MPSRLSGTTTNEERKPTTVDTRRFVWSVVEGHSDPRRKSRECAPEAVDDAAIEQFDAAVPTGVGLGIEH
jgi:hypothetical protein